jgi:hypothetical protein
LLGCGEDATKCKIARYLENTDWFHQRDIPWDNAGQKEALKE